MIMHPDRTPNRSANVGSWAAWPWPHSHACVAGFLPAAIRARLTGCPSNTRADWSMIHRSDSAPYTGR